MLYITFGTHIVILVVWIIAVNRIVSKERESFDKAKKIFDLKVRRRNTKALKKIHRMEKENGKLEF